MFILAMSRSKVISHMTLSLYKLEGKSQILKLCLFHEIMSKCSNCNRSTQGHPRPWGPECTLGQKLSGTSVDYTDRMEVNGARIISGKAENEHFPPFFGLGLMQPKKYNPIDSMQDKHTDFTAKDIFDNFLQDTMDMEEGQTHIDSVVKDGSLKEMQALQSSINTLATKFDRLLNVFEGFVSKISQQPSHLMVPHALQPVTIQQVASQVTQSLPQEATPVPPGYSQDYRFPPPLSGHGPVAVQPQVVAAIPAHTASASSSTPPSLRCVPMYSPPPAMPISTMAPMQAAVTVSTWSTVGSGGVQPQQAPLPIPPPAYPAEGHIRDAPISIQPVLRLPTEDVVLGENIVPKEVAIEAIQGRYVNLGKFAMIAAINQEHDTFTIRNDKFTKISKLTARSIASFDDWLLAWTNYEELLCRYLPPSANILAKSAAYRRFMQKSVATFQWQAVYTFDTSFRVGLSKSHSFDFDKIDMQLYGTTLTPLTLRTDLKACYRCGAISHLANSCPFRVGSPVETPEKKNATEGKPAICRNFNRGYCTWSRCTRQHICEHCSSPKPASVCDCRQGASA